MCLQMRLRYMPIVQIISAIKDDFCGSGQPITDLLASMRDV